MYYVSAQSAYLVESIVREWSSLKIKILKIKNIFLCADIKFSFNQPMSTTPAPSSNKTVNSAETNISYTFSPPKPVQSGGLKRIENVKTVYAFAMPTPVLPELTGSETKLEELTSLGQFKSAAMPDVTNNIKSKSDNMIQGELWLVLVVRYELSDWSA